MSDFRLRCLMHILGTFVLLAGLFLGSLAAEQRTEVEKKYVIAKDGLNVRATPDRMGRRVAILPYGEQIMILNEKPVRVTIDNKPGHWVKVSNNLLGKARVEGWAFDGFLSATDEDAKAAYYKRRAAEQDEEIRRTKEQATDPGNF